MVSLTGVLRRLGPLGRKLAWNREFREGAEFAGLRSETMVSLVAKYGEGRSVVELACGDGSLSRSLGAMPFVAYAGYDVSDEAIRLARQDAPPNRRFLVGQMEDWAPDAPFDLLIIEEAIYYLSQAQQERLLRLAFGAAPDARVVVTVHSGVKHRRSLDTCRRAARVVEEIAENGRVYLVLARPEGAATIG